MSNKRGFIWMAGLFSALIILLFSSCQKEQAGDSPTPEQTYTMKLSHAGPASDANDDYVGATAIKNYIEENSNGRVVVEIYSGGQLGNYQEVMEQVDNNTLEVAHTSIGGVTPFVPELGVIDLQYLIPGDDAVVKLLESSFFNDFSDEVNKQLPNVTLAGVCNGGGWRSFYTTSYQIRTAEDLDGLKIRTIDSPLQQEFVQQIGASPTPVAWSEVYTSLASELIVGLKIASIDIMSNKFDELIRYGVLDRHTFLFGFYFISDAWLKSMPEDLQKIVLDGIKSGAKSQTEFNQNRASATEQAFVDGGGILREPTETERESFLPARDAMMSWYVDQYDDKWLNAFREAIAAVE